MMFFFKPQFTQSLKPYVRALLYVGIYVVGVLTIVAGLYGVGMLSQAGARVLYGTLLAKKLKVNVVGVHSKSLKSKIVRSAKFYASEKYLKQLPLSSLVHAPVDVAALLQDDFDVIDRVCWVHGSPGEAVLEVHGVSPAFYIGEQFVLADNGRLYGRQDFSKLSGDELSRVVLEGGIEDNVLNCDVHALLKEIDLLVYAAYDVIYRSHEDIELVPKAGLPYRVVADARSVCDRRKIDTVMSVYEDFVKRSPSSCALAHGDTICLFDARFHDRIIVQPGRGNL
jgi:hypothetical protein